MDFTLDPAQEAMTKAVAASCSRFDDDYWYARDQSGVFPDDFFAAMAEAGVLGIALPEQYGGAGLGVVEAALVMHEIARSAGAQSAASAVHINIFGPSPIVRFGTEEQRQRWLPRLIEGRDKTCFGVTEPDAGLNTAQITTTAERDGDHYVVFGKKIWTSTAQVADKVMLLVRTTPLEQVAKKTHGLTLFYTDLDRTYAGVRRIAKMGRAAVDSNEVFYDHMPVPVADRIGEEGRGFEYALASLNAERVLIGMEAVGIGRNALARASKYARERVVFDRPIGQNQGI